MDDNRAASLRALERFQNALSLEERLSLYEFLLSLKNGVWQHSSVKAPETVRGFVGRLAKEALAQAQQRGGPQLVDDAEHLSRCLLLAFFFHASEVEARNPRLWFLRSALEMIDGTFEKKHRRGVSPANTPHAA